MGQTEVYEGKVKTVEFLNENEAKITFLDKITAGNGAKQDNIPGKGKLNLDLTNLLFDRAEIAGVPNHKIKQLSDTEILVQKLSIFPIEVVVRNFAAGSFASRYGIEDGKELEKPIVEYFVKSDELNDPLIDGEIAIAHNMISRENLSLITTRALQVNSAIKEYFALADMNLIDFKLEFGKSEDNQIFLADELSGDSMRVWDKNTNEKLDKDRFRKDLGDVLEGYQTIINRLNGVDLKPNPVPILAKINVFPKEGVTNPAGEVTKRALTNSGMDNLGEVVIGKEIKVQIEQPKGNDWVKTLHEIAKNLLSNPLIEEYTITYEII